MERMITFDCMFLECGRKFDTEDLLEDHVKRRHKDYYKDRYAYRLKENSETHIKKPNKILDDLENKINEIENNTILLNQNNDNELDLNIPNMENLELYNEQDESGNESEDDYDVITDEMLLIGGKYFQYEDVDEIEFEDRGLKEFKTNQDIDFSELSNVLLINLSRNLLRSLDDLKFFSKILILDISKNRVEDIFFVEELTSLNILNAECNKISSISSLVKCKNLEKLYLANNTVKYQMSSLKTLNTLQKLTELTIKNNTFLENTIGYKYMVIRRCRRLAKLDNEEITAVDRDVAKNFENMNNSDMRPNTSVGIAHNSNKIEELFPSEAQENSDDNLKNQAEEIVIEKDTKDKVDIIEEVETKINTNSNQNRTEVKDMKSSGVTKESVNNSGSKPSVEDKKITKTQTISNLAVKDKVISQVEYIPKKNIANGTKKAAEDSKLSKKPTSKITKNTEIKGKNQTKPSADTENDPVMKLNKINLKENPYKKIDQLEKEIEALKNKNIKLVEEKKNTEVSMNLLKSQVENMDKLNKEYEEIIESLKIELEKERQISKSPLEEKKNNANKQQQRELASTDDEEKTKLKEQLNILRKDYYDLLYQYSNSKVEAKASKMGMTSVEFLENQRPKSAIKRTVDDEYDKTVKELKDLRESQINFFSRKNALDDDINLERESENKKIIGDLLNENNEEEAEKGDDKGNCFSEDEENFELNHSSNFTNKSIKLNSKLLKESYNKPQNDLIEFDGDEEASEESDLDSIEELFRKSCMGLKELTSEIQNLNNQSNIEPNSQMRKERSRSKNPNKGDKTANNPYVHNANLNKLNRLKSKEKIVINEEDITNRENIASKKPSSAEELIKEAEREKNKITSMPIISDKSIKRPIIFPNASGAVGKIGGPKLIIKKEQDQNSFISNMNNSIIEDNNLDKKPSNKIIFKPTSLTSNPLKPIESRISPYSTLSEMKQNLNNNSNLDLNSNYSPNTTNSLGLGLNTHKNILMNKPSLNSSNPNSTINSGKINFNPKINLSNFNNTETEKTNNTSFNTQNSSNKNNNHETENLLNTSNSNNNQNYNLKNLNTLHLKSNSTLSGDSANLILNNFGSNGLNKNKDNYSIGTNKNDNLGINTEDGISNKYKISSNNSNKNVLNTETINLNSDRGGFNKNFDSEKILINNKISDVSNIRNNISLKKPAIMGAAYGNTGNSKPLLKTKTETISNKKLEDVNSAKK